MGDFGGSYDNYWSSTEYNMTDAYGQFFGDGTYGTYEKVSNGLVRAVRAF